MEAFLAIMGPSLIAGPAIAAAAGALGAYLSYFVDGATGAVIVLLQTALFLAAFAFAPTHGLLASRRRAAARLAVHDRSPARRTARPSGGGAAPP